MSLIHIARRHNCEPDYFSDSNPLKQSSNKQDYNILEHFKSFFWGFITLSFSNIPKNIKATIKFISWRTAYKSILSLTVYDLAAAVFVNKQCPIPYKMCLIRYCTVDCNFCQHLCDWHHIIACVSGS